MSVPVNVVVVAVTVELTQVEFWVARHSVVDETEVESDKVEVRVVKDVDRELVVPTRVVVPVGVLVQETDMMI